MKKKVELVSLKCLTPDERWIKLYSAQCKRGKKPLNWTFASRKKIPEISGGKVKPDAVIIVPFIYGKPHADGTYRLVVTKEYRVPLGCYEYGFPAGLIEKDVEESAIRELKEETGLDVEKVYFITPPLYSSAGMTDESTVMVFVLAKGKISKKHQEDGEDIETLLLSPYDVGQLLLQKGKFKGAKISCKFWPIAYSFMEHQRRSLSVTSNSRLPQGKRKLSPPPLKAGGESR